MKGSVKIDMACRLSEVDQIDYAWVDTCCIDKRSSAELTEAINSMFRRYEGAELCYAFLSDLEPESASLDMWAALAPCRWYVRQSHRTGVMSFADFNRLGGSREAGHFRNS